MENNEEILDSVDETIESNNTIEENNTNSEKIVNEKEEVVNSTINSAQTITPVNKSNGSKALSIAALVISILAFLISIVSLIIAIGSSVVGTITNNDAIGNFTDSFNNMMEEDSNYTAQKINTILEVYNGSQTGTKTKDFIDKVVLSNSKYPEYIVSISYNSSVLSSKEDLTQIKSVIEDNKTYNITFDYKSDGAIEKATIVEE